MLEKPERQLGPMSVVWLIHPKRKVNNIAAFSPLFSLQQLLLSLRELRRE